MLNEKNERELVYVVSIQEIRPIEGYDRVEYARIGAGWWIIVRKNQFKVGDLAIYFEIDSLVPSTNPAFEFMAKRDYKVKTLKMCKVVSQGLLMSAEDFGGKSGVDSLQINGKSYAEGDFLTKDLGVVYADPSDNIRKAPSSDKYRSMQDRHKKLFSNKFIKWVMKYKVGRAVMFFFFGKKKDKKNAWPSWVSHSDQERIQNLPMVCGYDKDPYYETTKIDGTSSTFVCERHGRKLTYNVYSRNVHQISPAQPNYHSDTENVYWQASDKYHIRGKLEHYMDLHPECQGIALQGEIAGCSLNGVKIQGDPHKFEELRFFGYDIYLKGVGKINFFEAVKISDLYDIPWVPVVRHDYILPDTVEELLAHVTGPCEALGASGLREGYVYRKRGDSTFSFKAVSNEYLLKHHQ